MKLAVRVAAASFVVATVVLGAALPARAHALLDHSDPAGGSILQKAPSVVSLFFTEEPDPRLSVVHVLDSNAKDVEAGSLRSVARQPKELQIPLPSSGLPNGVYTVSWRVVSRQDGHVTAGAFSFGIGVAPGNAAGGGQTVVPKTPSPSAASVVGKALLYAGLSLLLGACVAGLLAFGGHVPARRVVLPAGWALAAVGAVTMLVAERNVVGVSLGGLLSSTTGHAYVALLVTVGVAGVATAVAVIAVGRATLAIVGAAAAAAMFARADGSHAAAATSLPFLQILLQWFHFAALGVWIGGLALVFLLLRERRSGEAPQTEVRRFSRIAGYALAVVAATGVLRAADELGGYSRFLHLFSLSYGTTLAIKVAVGLALIGLGAFNRYRSIPAMDRRGTGALRSVVGGELVLAVGIFGLTGALTGFSPRLPPVERRTPQAVTAEGSDFATTTRVHLVVTPGQAGLNAFDAAVTDYDTGKPLPVDHVTLTFQPVGQPNVGTSTLDLKRGGGHWEGNGTQLSLQGTWNVTALVQTGPSSTTVPLTVTTRPPPETVSVSRASGQPDIYTITLQSGLELQAYNDPGTPGANELHVTAFDAQGNELPLASATITAVPSSGSAVPLTVRRLGPGHFVGDEQLTAGAWRFELLATARNGDVLVASFDQTIQ